MADDTGAPFFLPFDEGADSANGPLAFENLGLAVHAALANILDGDQAFSRAKIVAAAEAYLELRDTSAADPLERFRLHTESGQTRLMAVDDTGAVAQTFLALDHATGRVTFADGEGAIGADARDLAIGAGGASSPDAASIAWGDDTGWKLRLGTKIAGVFAERFSFSDEGIFKVGALPVAGSVRGHVSATATIVAGSGFTPAQVGGAGTYRLTFPADTFSAPPLVLVHQVGPGVAMHHQIDPTTWTATQVNLRFYLQDATTLANAAFVFEAKDF